VGETAFTRGHQNVIVTEVIKNFLTFCGNLYLIILFTKHATGPCPESIYEYGGADKSLARPTFGCILFDGENISFDASSVTYTYIYSTNIPPIMIINRLYNIDTHPIPSHYSSTCL
jgi:hypothetical protein